MSSTLILPWKHDAGVLLQITVISLCCVELKCHVKFLFFYFSWIQHDIHFTTSCHNRLDRYGRVLQSGGAIIFVLEKLLAMRPTTAKGLLTGVMDESS